jgi:hypothetical protein
VIRACFGNAFSANTLTSESLSATLHAVLYSMQINVPNPIVSGMIVASMGAQIDASLLADDEQKDAFMLQLRQELAVKLNVPVEDIQIARLRTVSGTDATLRRLQTSQVTFDVIVSGQGATEKLEQFKLQQANPETADIADGGILSRISVQSSLSFECPAGTRLEDKFCKQCPFPEITQDSVNCERCAEPDRMVPNAIGDQCVCSKGTYDSYMGHHDWIDLGAAENLLEMFCWSRNRLDEPSKDPEAIPEHTRDVSIGIGRRCVACPSCLTCDWRDVTIEGNMMEVADMVNSERIVYDATDAKFKEVGRYEVSPGFGLADPNNHTLVPGVSGTVRVDFFACEGKSPEVPCPGFELDLLDHERDLHVCQTVYSDFLCAHCEEKHVKIEGICEYCDAVNWPSLFVANLVTFVIAFGLLHKSTKCTVDVDELRHM